jgi:nickel-dependent lactate racemase
MNVGTPVLKRGGLLIIAAELRHGVGTSASEKRFYDELKKMASPDEFISEVRRSGCITGVHRAYMVARALKGCRAAFVTERYKEFEGLTPLKFFRGMDEAIGYADNLYGEDSTIYVIPHALSTIADIE